MEEVECASERDQISGNIAKTTEPGSFIAVCWNRITDLLDGIIRKLEFVAVCIDELAGTLVGRF